MDHADRLYRYAVAAESTIANHLADAANYIRKLEVENEQLRLAYRTLRGMLANAGQSAHAVTESVRQTLDAFPVDPTEYGDK